MDLNKIVNEAMVSIQQEGFVEKVVKDRLQETLKKVVDDMFGSYGDFRKQLENEVKDKLKINLDKLDLGGYNLMVLNEVKAALDKAMHIQGAEKIKEHLEELLTAAKPEYKLSELIEMFKEEANENHEYDGDYISFHCEQSRHSRGGGLAFIYFDKEERKEKYRCDYGLTVDLGDGSVKSVKIDGKETDNKSIMRGFHGFERTMFQIFASGAKVIVDEDEVDTSYGYDD
ncbi:hypothetical protein [Paenibacillus sp. MBLB4367]|uniref:hypothetical protein n=1 Tax=Paenibacillus sp. MBLB4367 TaxID=3384767 RepID=UPI00390823D0